MLKNVPWLRKPHVLCLSSLLRFFCQDFSTPVSIFYIFFKKYRNDWANVFMPLRKQVHCLPFQKNGPAAHFGFLSSILCCVSVELVDFGAVITVEEWSYCSRWLANHKSTCCGKVSEWEREGGMFAHKKLIISLTACDSSSSTFLFFCLFVFFAGKSECGLLKLIVYWLILVDVASFSTQIGSLYIWHRLDCVFCVSLTGLLQIGANPLSWWNLYPRVAGGVRLSMHLFWLQHHQMQRPQWVLFFFHWGSLYLRGFSSNGRTAHKTHNHIFFSLN